MGKTERTPTVLTETSEPPEGTTPGDDLRRRKREIESEVTEVGELRRETGPVVGSTGGPGEGDGHVKGQ